MNIIKALYVLRNIAVFFFSITLWAIDDGERYVINNIIKPNAVIFDVGANIGEWSQLVLKTNPRELYAFEPIPEIFQELLRKVESQKNVFSFNIAMSNTIGTRDFFYYDKETWSGHSSFFLRPILLTQSPCPPKKITVTTVSIDQFCKQQGINHIDFVKIDTEGAELEVLMGALEMLLNNQIDAIQFEYGGTYFDAKTTLKSVYTLLSHCGYYLYKITNEQGLVFLPEWDDIFETYGFDNFLALKRPA